MNTAETDPFFLLKSPGAFLRLLRDTFNEWNEDKAPRLAATLAYYTIFSIAPLLVIAIAIAGLVFGQEAARGQLDNQIQGLIGPVGADAVQEMIQSASKPSSGILATVIGLITLLFGASGVFAQLKDALNTIWDVPPAPNRGVRGILRGQFLSFTMMLGIGFLLLVSLVISAGLSAFGSFLGEMFPGLTFVMQIVNIVISFAVVTLLFAIMFKVLPDAAIAWSDVWFGAAFTALLFTIGKFLIGVYLGSGTVASAYGAAGSLVVLLLWVYYSAQILFFGAEFAQVYANQYGSRLSRAEVMRPASTQSTPTHAPTPVYSRDEKDIKAAVSTIRRTRFKKVAEAASYVGTFLVGGLAGRVIRRPSGTQPDSDKG